MAKKLLRKEEKSKNKTKIFVPVFIIAVMVLGTVGFMFGSGDDEESSGSVEIDGVMFYAYEGNRWIADSNNKQYLLDFLPEHVSDVEVPVFYAPKKTYLIFNPIEKDGNMEYVLSKFEYNLGNFGKNVVYACDSEEECADIPIKDCSEDFGFYFKKSSEKKMFIDGECVIVQGDIDYMNRAVDKIVMGLVGIE